MIINERIQSELESLRLWVDQPSPGVADWDRLMTLLKVAFCDHKFTDKRTGGNPAEPGSNEVVRVCEVCGIED